jgi:hypothetical protein
VAVENDAIAGATCTARNNSWGHRAELVHGAAGCGTSGDARFLVAVTFAAEIGDVRRFASCALPSRERTDQGCARPSADALLARARRRGNASFDRSAPDRDPGD